MGFNAEGRIIPKNNDYDRIFAIEKELFELKHKKKQKNSRNFDFILGNVPEGSRPWDF